MVELLAAYGVYYEQSEEWREDHEFVDALVGDTEATASLDKRWAIMLKAENHHKYERIMGKVQAILDWRQENN